MSDINLTSIEARRLEESEDANVEKSKDFLTSSLKWSFALFGVKDFLVNMQATFIGISVALIMLFGINSRTRRSNRGTTFINFAFYILGCLVVGIAIDSIIQNSYIKWVVYGVFLAMVATNPDYQQTFPEMKRIFKSVCGATSLRLRDLFNQSQIIIKNLFRIGVVSKESSKNNTPATRSVGNDEGEVGENIV